MKIEKVIELIKAVHEELAKETESFTIHETVRASHYIATGRIVAAMILSEARKCRQLN